MKSKILITVLFFLFGTFIAKALDLRTDNILRLVNLDKNTITQNKIVTMLGQPDSTDISKKRTKWIYRQENSTLVIVWKNDGDRLEKFIFTNVCQDKKECNMDLQQKLKNGDTDITQTVKLLGIPADMTIKEDTQIMHYSYQGTMARLFFRNNKLVDFALVESNN